MAKAEKYIPTVKAQTFLDKVTDAKHDRQIINGLKKFLDDRAPEDMLNFYTEEEKQALIAIKGTEQEISEQLIEQLKEATKIICGSARSMGIEVKE